MKKLYFKWFISEIEKGATFRELYKILELIIDYYLENKSIIVIDNTYIFSFIVNLIYSIGMGKNITYSYFYKKINNLIINMIKNNKAFYFYKKFKTGNIGEI